MTTMLLLVLVSALVACQFHAANASFVRGGVVEQIPSDGASRTELEQQARIEELQAQLAELQRSLAQCSTQQLTNSSEVVSPRVVKVEPVRPEPLAVDAIRVVREYASPNWHNSSTARRLGDLTADGDDSTKPVIGICLASTSKSKKTKISGISVIPLFQVLLPSLANTVEPGFEYRVYVGVDTGDSFYDNEKNEKEIMTWFKKNVQTKATILGADVSLKVIVFENKDHKPGPAFNKACKTAYDEGADYMYRVNDDSEFRTTFAKAFVAELQNRCPPNIGVTGPTCHEGNTHILTHDFTHRHHMKIFKEQYYPVELTDWWLDDWVTHVYGKHHTSRVLDVVVKHHIGAAGTRYTVNKAAKTKLAHLQSTANNAIKKYVADNFPDANCDEAIGPVSKELPVSAKPEFFTAIPGVVGIVIDPENEDGAHRARNVANNKECSHKCQTALKCVGYTWIGKDSETVIGALKAILSISMDDDDGGGGTCYLFDEEQAGNLHKVQYHHRGQSGIKKQHASAFSDRLQALLGHIDPMDKDQFSSDAIKVSFGGGKVDGWLTDSGAVSKSTKNPVTDKASSGSFGWNCDMKSDARARKSNDTPLLNTLQIMSRHGKCSSPRWALEVPNGIYRVVVGYSDPSEPVVAENCKLNGDPAHDGSEIAGNYFEFQSFQEIKNNQLVFSGKYAKRCTSVAFIVVDEATHYFG